MRVLVLEDQERFAQLLKQHLEQAGFVIDTVETVAAFRALLQSDAYDMLIVDLGLPDGDGADAIKDYRQRGGITPIIVVTARNRVNDLVKALEVAPTIS